MLLDPIRTEKVYIPQGASSFPKPVEDDFFEEDEDGCVFSAAGTWTRTAVVEEKVWRKIRADIPVVDGVDVVYRGGCVEVKGVNQDDVLYIYSEIVEKIETNLKPTHFICIPFIEPSVINKYNEFRQAVKDLPVQTTLRKETQKLHEYLLPSPNKLHQTLCVLALTDDSKVVAATAALEEFRNRYYGGRLSEGPLIEIPLRTLKSMQDDISETKVLYTGDFTQCQESIHAICDLLYECLVDKGLVSRTQLANQRVLDSSMKKAQLKLHVTVVNTKYAKKDVKFDARDVLTEWGEKLDFGVAVCEEIRLCELSAKKSDDGFYSTIATIYL